MKVVDKSQNVETEFRCLELADIFKIDDRILMKVSGSFDGGHNVYDLTKERLTDIDKNTKVRYVPSELILHERDWDAEN